jgi:O-antigen ligase
MIQPRDEMASSQVSIAGFVTAENRVGMERAALLLERVAFYGLLSLVALAAIPYGGVDTWWTAVISCLVFFLVSLRILEGLLRRNLAVAGIPMVIPLLVLCLFAGLQTVPLGALSKIYTDNAQQAISIDPYETQRFIFRLLAAVLAGESLLRYTSTRKRLAAVVSVVIGIGVLSAAFGVFRQMVQHDSGGFILPRLALGTGYGQFINQNHFALLMEMSLGLLLGLMVVKNKARHSLLAYASMALLVWTALVFTNSRGGVISMLGLILFATIVHLMIGRWQSSSRERSRSRNWVVKYGTTAAMSGALAVSLILLTAVGVSWAGGDPVVTRLESVSGELRQGSVGSLRRKEIWQATWELIKSHPLTGAGFGSYETAIPKFATSFSGEELLSQAHNDYLEILASGGLVGAMFVAWFIVALIRNVLQRLRARSSFRYSTCLGAIAGLFAVSIHSFFDFGLHVTVNALVFTCLVVIATANCSAQPQLALAQRT